MTIRLYNWVHFHCIMLALYERNRIQKHFGCFASTTLILGVNLSLPPLRFTILSELFFHGYLF